MTSLQGLQRNGIAPRWAALIAGLAYLTNPVAYAEFYAYPSWLLLMTSVERFEKPPTFQSSKSRQMRDEEITRPTCDSKLLQQLWQVQVISGIHGGASHIKRD